MSVHTESDRRPGPGRLHAESVGQGPRVVAVHGFTQTHRCWGPVVDDLAVDHEVVLVDAPAHGGSIDAPVGLWEAAPGFVEIGGPATYLGYSMGGRYLLHTALVAPAEVRRLVLIGATAGIVDRVEREARAEHDRATAGRLRRVGLEPFLADWVAQPLFAGVPEQLRFTRERAVNSVAGLARSLLEAGTGSQEPTWDRLSDLSMPVLCVAGAQDRKYAEIGGRLVEAVGANASLALVPGAGHAAHLEAPAAFIRVLREWLASTG